MFEIEALSAFGLTNPQMRTFWLYLLASALLALVVLFFKAASATEIKAQLRQLLSPSLWWNRSTGLDVQWILLNHLLRVFVIVPLLGGQLIWALAVNRVLYNGFGEGNFIHLANSLVALIFTLSLFLVDDFARFFFHYLYHKVPLLWRFHSIHHSATTLNPLTLYRVHWVEMILNSLRSLLVIGTLSGLFIYCVDGAIGKVEVLGASIFNFAFNMAGSNLRHSPIWLGFGKFEKWFISPAQHQIHHSIYRKHYDKNFGSALAIWDRLFGCWRGSQTELPPQFGIEGIAPKQTLWRQLWGLKT